MHIYLPPHSQMLTLSKDLNVIKQGTGEEQEAISTDTTGQATKLSQMKNFI